RALALGRRSDRGQADHPRGAPRPGGVDARAGALRRLPGDRARSLVAHRLHRPHLRPADLAFPIRRARGNAYPVGVRPWRGGRGAPVPGGHGPERRLRGCGAAGPGDSRGDRRGAGRGVSCGARGDAPGRARVQGAAGDDALPSRRSTLEAPRRDPCARTLSRGGLDQDGASTHDRRRRPERTPRCFARRLRRGVMNGGLRASILLWYVRHRRDLPWRRTREPYAIWVSEVMLQQTRVETVIPYYQRFLRRFPGVESLARARGADVQASWFGLGYYRRARHLHAAARIIVREHSGRVPSNRD